ncbi:hypothetical protein F0562_015165 [Nyssa sinensis]|uniref:Uncharacterized protein n=1 Tax=Nyssa sinensis TaxID=561372 RepID=A0A5J4ZKD3_9ASTE|nr:hypothetical protein F0562_015165 [Nyssa sinensis]
MALSTIQRAIDAVTSNSTGEVAPDPKILIVKAMEQRWVDGEGSDVGRWVSATCWWLMGFRWVQMGSSRGGSVVRFLRIWLGLLWRYNISLCVCE